MPRGSDKSHPPATITALQGSLPYKSYCSFYLICYLRCKTVNGQPTPLYTAAFPEVGLVALISVYLSYMKTPKIIRFLPNFPHRGFPGIPIDMRGKLVNWNLGWESSFPVSVESIQAMQPSRQATDAVAEHKQEVSSLNLNLSLRAWLQNIS